LYSNSNLLSCFNNKLFHSAYFCFLQRRVNLAMLNALELSEHLTSDNFKDLQTTNAMYEKEMRTRAVEEARSSMEMTNWMHAKDAQTRLVEFFYQNS
jgi:hypothetical protein